jgi:hypothetical protein
MTGMIDVLNQNNGAITVVFSAVVAIATVVYAILTWKLVSETIKMREAQTEPKISATIQADERYINWINLIIQNIGQGPAYNVKFELNPDFEDKNIPDVENIDETFKLSEVGFIKNGLPYFAPDQRIQLFLTNLAEDFKKKLETPFEIKIIYENSIHKLYSDLYMIDFSQQRRLNQVGKPPIYEISKNLEDINKTLKMIFQPKQ